MTLQWHYFMLTNKASKISEVDFKLHKCNIVLLLVNTYFCLCTPSEIERQSRLLTCPLSRYAASLGLHGVVPVESELRVPPQAVAALALRRLWHGLQQGPFVVI
jgi:hypothetical protein